MNTEFRVNYTKKSHFRYNVFMLYGNNFPYLLVNIIVFITGLLLLFSSPDALLLAILLTLLPFIMFFSMMAQAYSNFAKSKVYHYSDTFIISNESINVSSEVSKSVIKVEDLNKIYIAKNLIVIMIGKIQGYILTKETVELMSLEEIKVLLVKYMPKNKIVFRPNYRY